MFVSDLRHFLGIPDDAPAPLRRMAQHLGSIVKAGSAAEPGLSWVSGIGCIRRPGRKPCSGRICILRSELPPEIRWKCIVCGDEGCISGWKGSSADLGNGSVPPAAEGASAVVPYEIAKVLRSITYLDSGVERMVYRARAVANGVVLEGNLESFRLLVDTVAAECDLELNRRCRKRLDDASAIVVDALDRAQANAQLVGGPTATIRLRDATPDDFEGVLTLWRIADVEPTHTDDVESLTRLLDRDRFALLIAEADGQVVGTVICGWDGWRGSIYRLAVAPTHQRTGVARTLVAAGEDRLRSFGAVRLAAVVAETSPAAVGFWTTAGWERQSNRARFVKG
ncbi:MAG: GNAT family N-acetyltransferase [Acidimicrobiales bacterium]